MNQELSLLDLFIIMRKRIGIIVLGTLMGVLMFSLYTFAIAVPKYSSTTQMIVNRTQETNIIQRTDIDTNVQLINTYKDILNSPAILDDVRDELDLDISHQGLTNQLFVTSENESQVFSLQIVNEDPVMAATIANTTASIFKENLNDIMSVDNVTVISQAEPNMSPVTPNHILNIVLGTIIGSVLSTVLAFVLEFMDNTVKDFKIVTDNLGLTHLGSVYEIPVKTYKEENLIIIPEKLEEVLDPRVKI